MQGCDVERCLTCVVESEGPPIESHGVQARQSDIEYSKSRAEAAMDGKSARCMCSALCISAVPDKGSFNSAPISCV